MMLCVECSFVIAERIIREGVMRRLEIGIHRLGELMRWRMMLEGRGQAAGHRRCGKATPALSHHRSMQPRIHVRRTEGP